MRGDTMRDDRQEVIDPDDPRYRRPEDFNRDPYDQQRGRFGGPGQFYYRSVGCTPIGCFPGCLISIILSIILTVLLNLLLW
ncbi:hypothetical protein HHH54_00550 [Staphylococcus sp. H16/1A]|uniref:Uncharacterized protein n=2 Tax=Staphylococcus canis TaxID=2724942 RepID=A0ABS0T5Z7_9STAP|nr:hypothetical protein [Staphylococcus canis]